MFKKSLLFAVVATLSMAGPSASWARAAETPSLFSLSLRMLWGLLVVLGILLIIYGLVKKRVGLMQGGGKGVIKVVETRHLLPKKTLFLVEVRGKEYLLGSGSDSIELIAALDGSATTKSFHGHLHGSNQVR